jgi:3-hydroxyacyl-CoA dehydrogenase
VRCETLEQALEGVFWVQESGPENIDAKRALYAELDRLAPPKAVLASSTSTLDMTKIAQGLQGASRCVVAHPVNPPHVVPVVEVLGGAHTDPLVVRKSVRFMERVGQTPVLLRKYVPGFLLNRMQAALVREAVSLVKNGVATPEGIDAVIRDGLGLRWALLGPFGVANTNADGGLREYFARYGPSLQMLSQDLTTELGLTPELIESMGKSVDAVNRRVPRDLQRSWRDDMVVRIRELKSLHPVVEPEVDE